MLARYLYLVELPNQEPFATNNALEVMFAVRDMNPKDVTITFEWAPGRKVAITYNLYDGVANTEELNPGYRDVTEVYDFQIDPIEKAISIVAKAQLFEWLVKEIKDKRISDVISSNHFDVNNPQECRCVRNIFSELDMQHTFNQLHGVQPLRFVFTVSKAHAIVRQELTKAVFAGVQSLGSVETVTKRIQARLQELNTSRPVPAARSGKD